MNEGLTLAKLIEAKELLDAADVPPDARPLLWGPPSRRRNRTERRPVRRWKEKLARMEHKAQLRRWRNKPMTMRDMASIREALGRGRLTEFMGFKFIQS